MVAAEPATAVEGSGGNAGVSGTETCRPGADGTDSGVARISGGAGGGGCTRVGAAGAPISDLTQAGEAGTAGSGGDGGGTLHLGGGGGGGYFGGGGGAGNVECCGSGGGGGGGSSYGPPRRDLLRSGRGRFGADHVHRARHHCAGHDDRALAVVAERARNWYTSAVAVDVSASDEGFGVAETRCVVDPATAPASYHDLPAGPCTTSGVGVDGAHALYAASADVSGNEETPVATTFKIDATRPIVSPSISPSTTLLLNQSGAVASPNASDATSGLASSFCGAVDTRTVGTHTVTCSATDKAGNSATADASYTVGYALGGFQAPVDDAPTVNAGGGGNAPIPSSGYSPTPAAPTSAR